MGFPSNRLRDRGRLFWGVMLFLAGIGLVLGCGRGSFVGRQYDDLTAYYNTFYNANQAFEAGLESVNESGGDIDRTRYLSVFPIPQGGTGESSFEKAIQKSADVLRDHPNSEWVDDALLLIGRARYYQQNYVGAAQKFREVIGLGAEREGEARFRLVQTLLAADRTAEAADALRAGLDTEADYGTWTARMRLARGVLSVRQQGWEAAEQALVQGLEGPLPDDAGARGAFLLGQVRETRDQFGEAEDAYRRVLEYDPAYPLAFAARLSALEMQGLNGAPKRALRQLESLERGDNTSEMRGEIVRVRARLYLIEDRPDRARQALLTLLRSDEAPRGTVLGRIHYDLAVLYRDQYEDFTRAAAHFDTAATNLSDGPEGGPAGEEQALPRASSDASEEADRFQGLAEHSEAVARMDSLLRLGQMPRSEFQAVVEKIRQRRLEQQQDDADTRRDRQRQFRGGGRAGAAGRSTSRSSQQNAVQTRGSDAGFLFHRDPTLVQQGRRQFEQTWGERPLVDNWRRVEAIEGGATATAAEDAERAPRAESQARSTPSARVVDVSAVPRDSASRAEMEAERAVARYRLANALYRNANRPDSAEAWYIKILGQDWEHPVAKQALYGLAQAHRAQNDSTAAAEALHYIVQEYPGTPYAERARQQLGLDPVESASAPVTGTKADSAYAQAYAAWQRGAHNVALEKFLAVADAYQETSAAPRALLAAGVIYYRTVRHDSSGRGRARFRQYTDSLAQAVASDLPRDTTRSSQDAVASAPSQSSDPATPVRTRSADTTARTGPRRVVNPRASDTSDADDPGEPPRRMLDSTAVTAPTDQGTSGSAPDSAATLTSAVQDTTVRAKRSRSPDTTGREAMPDSATITPRGLPEAATGPFEVLLMHLTDKYSDRPVVERAEALLTRLREQKAVATSPAPDSVRSTATAPASPSSTDSTAGPRQSSPRPAPATETSSDTSSRRTDRPSGVDLETKRRRDTTAASGDWSIVVSSQATRSAAEKAAARFEDRFDPVRVVPFTVDGTQRYRVTVGRFESSTTAENALNERDSVLPSDAWVFERP